ncbi:putative NADH dehydrogenase [Chrysochromulina tobinii]|uniref:Putative NADH dehydrogenase n=1 Tax=Chrysochromulina tobinii TaxID=1460289 RepID=A0A0M0JYN0_9EUKA|nr:putative NADH dehydrogenase [Chrysochromulina tobinii]|eukprot:KOO31665.1 putative NADH dehydrogenase [Chrysochromulina sp. CCMP291]
MLARIATRVAARQLPPALFVRQKTTTGIVGLEVVPDAKPVLLGLYAKTLSMLEGVPAEAQYRKVVTDYTKARMAVLESTDDIPTIESKIDGGQVEQLIEQAKDELSLIPKLIAARAFDPYNGSPAEDILTDLKRRGVALQRYDIPMRPSQDYPVETAIELELPAVPEPPKKA